MSYYDAPTCGVKANYRVKAGEQVQVKAAISYVSAANAWENLRKDCDHWDFDRVRTTSQAEWNAWLVKIAVADDVSASLLAPSRTAGSLNLRWARAQTPPGESSDVPSRCVGGTKKNGTRLAPRSVLPVGGGPHCAGASCPARWAIQGRILASSARQAWGSSRRARKVP